MKTDLLDKRVMVLYDIRDIQKYIFNTNKVRDIIGASLLVENLLERGIAECLKKHPEIEDRMDEQFIGGGNACYLFQIGKDAEVINRELAGWILKKTRSLQLAIAAVPVTERYDQDYENLQKEMTRIKMKMPKTSLMGALPIAAHEETTGLPVTRVIQGPEGKERVSTEVAQKRRMLYEKAETAGIKFDDMVDQKEKDSTLAIVHIDGNSMGKRIKALMEHETDYRQAMEKMKKVSESINLSFQEAFQQMEEKITRWAERTLGEDTQKRYIRKIICAGDDITFVCTGKLALTLVEAFVHALNDKEMYLDISSERGEPEEKKFSVCAGIAYMHSHFPFSDAYQIAEQCCENAKKKAKQKERRVGDIVGNWVDFQVCKDIYTMYLETSREKNYLLAGGEYLIKRPYYIPYENEQYPLFQKMNEINEQYSFEHLIKQLDYICGSGEPESTLKNSDWKELRNSYALGENTVDEFLTFLRSRGKTLYSQAFDENGVAQWYDALEMYELYVDIEK